MATKKKSPALNDVGAEQFKLVETRSPERVVLRCPNCGSVLTIVEKLESKRGEVACLACKAVYLVEKK